MTMTADASVLLLNAGGPGDPLERISWQRAAKLLYKGKAVLCTKPMGMEYTLDDVTNSGTLSFHEPGVIRLVKYVNPYKKGVRFSRWNVLQRDEMTCQYCGRTLSTKSLTLDHVVPRSHGGRTTWDNVVAACQKCNQRKGARALKDSGLRLRKKPGKPSLHEFIRLSLGRNLPDTWRDFIYWNCELEP